MSIGTLRLVAATLACAFMEFVFAEDKPTAKTPAQETPKTTATTPVNNNPELPKLLAKIPDVAATYGKNKKVTGDEIRDILRPQIEQMVAAGQLPPEEEILRFARQMAEGIVTQHLFVKEAESKGFKPDREAGKKQLEEIKSKVGAENFTKMLVGMNYTEEKALVAMAEMAMLQKFFDSINVVEDADAEKFYKAHPEYFAQMSASHILAKYPGNPDSGDKPTEDDKKKAMDKIRKAQKSLAEGKAFADVAKEQSDCPSKKKGGDLGKFAAGQMVPEFEEALQKLKPGEISDPVETRFGIHLIKAGEKSTTSFAEARESIVSFLKQQNTHKIQAQLQARLLKNAGLKILIPMPTPKTTPKTEPKTPPVK